MVSEIDNDIYSDNTFHYQPNSTSLDPFLTLHLPLTDLTTATATTATATAIASDHAYFEPVKEEEVCKVLRIIILSLCFILYNTIKNIL